MKNRASTRRAAAALVAAACLATPAAADVVAAVREVLEHVPGRERRSEEHVRAALVALGEPAVPVLFGLTVGEGLEQVYGLTPDEDAAFDLDAWWCPPDTLPPLAHSALVALPADAVVDHVERRCTDDAPLELRMAIARVLGPLGSGRGLPLLSAITAGVPEHLLRYRSVRTTLVGAWSSILTNDTAAHEQVPALFAAAAPPVRALLLDCLGAVERPHAAVTFGRLIGLDPTLDVTILEHAAALRARFPWLDLWDPTGRLETLTIDHDWTARRRALVALGRMGSVRSFEQIVVRLEVDDREAARDAARWALAEIAGVDRGPDPQAWRAWHAEQTDWWLERGRALASELPPDPADVLEAVSALTQPRLYRHDAAAAIGTVLDARDDAAVVLAACAALRNMGSLRPVPALVRELDHADEDVRTAAWTALRALTGRDLPATRDAWRAYVVAE